MMVTHDFLLKHRPCPAGLELFDKFYPDGIEWCKYAQLDVLFSPVRMYLGWGWVVAGLKRFSMSGAELHDANLRGADLGGADLRGADLGDADLYGANLCNADLRDANLRGAHLRYADLYGANMIGADLFGADMRGAYMFEVKR